MKSAHYRWVGADALEVDLWEFETVTHKVDEKQATVALQDGTIHLGHALRDVQPEPVAVAPACLLPVHLTYRVGGLARTDYLVTVRGVSEIRLEVAR